MKRVLSCIQPTGQMHFGNYFGAVKNWVDLQNDYECIYGIVDYHAITAPYEPEKLKNNIWDLVINLMAVGIKEEHLFIQSLIPEHAELGWILGCFTPYGRLAQMTQFKDKSDKIKEEDKEAFVSSGLFTYPVLQAADILIYKADFVPVGKDQEQHLELTKTIAQRYNHQIGKEYFVLPEPLFTEVPKVMSTADPNRKMSKSAGEKHYIDVFADEKTITKQIRSAVTDAGTDNTVMSPGLVNLFSLLKACHQDEAIVYFTEAFNQNTLKYVEIKDAVANALIAMNTPFIERKKELLSDKKTVKYNIKRSSERIREIAQSTVKEVKELSGLLNAKL